MKTQHKYICTRDHGMPLNVVPFTRTRVYCRPTLKSTGLCVIVYHNDIMPLIHPLSASMALVSTHKKPVIRDPNVGLPLTHIAKTIGMPSMKHRCETSVLDEFLVDVEPKVFAIWVVDGKSDIMAVKWCHCSADCPHSRFRHCRPRLVYNGLSACVHN